MPSPHELEAQIFQALASPVRVRMLELLRASGRMTVSEMQQRLGIEAANASQHLRVLRDRGLVERRRDGASIWYAIADPSLHALATEVGLDVLVEIHDETELDAALSADATLVGVNQRDLVTFEVDHDRALRMAGLMPAGVVRVAESGVRGPDDAGRLHRAGYHAVLVGETLVTSGDPAAAVRSLTLA